MWIKAACEDIQRLKLYPIQGIYRSLVSAVWVKFVSQWTVYNNEFLLHDSSINVDFVIKHLTPVPFSQCANNGIVFLVNTCLSMMKRNTTQRFHNAIVKIQALNYFSRLILCSFIGFFRVLQCYYLTYIVCYLIYLYNLAYIIFVYDIDFQFKCLCGIFFWR